MTRRNFAGAGATAASYSRILGAADRVRMGFVGLGNRGDQVHTAFLEWGDHQTVAICDLRDDYLDLAARKSRGTPTRYQDYRRLLDNKDVDAVAIATPDHWHALMMIDACNAGKDVYVEKPLSLTVVEGRKMVEAAERTKRVVQVGTQRRSSKVVQEAVAYVRSGELGQVSLARGYEISSEWPAGIGNPPDRAPPSEEEWDRWLGPAPKVPYNPNRAYYLFRYFYNYSGGQMTNIGVHLIDTMRWCLNLESPRKVTALGGRYVIKDNREIPDTMEAVWCYPDGVLATFAQINANSAACNNRDAFVEFRGSEGTLYVTPNQIEIVPEVVRTEEIPALSPLERAKNARQSKATTRPADKAFTMTGRTDTEPHARNFLDCVKSRGECTCPIEVGHRSTTTTLLANIACDRGRELLWDREHERFTNDAEANKLLSYEYRPPWKLP